jgi:hypothetical protein
MGAGAPVAAPAGAAVELLPATGAAPPPTALTAFSQFGESFDMLFCRHCNDAAPPGGTLAQFF